MEYKKQYGFADFMIYKRDCHMDELEKSTTISIKWNIYFTAFFLTRIIKIIFLLNRFWNDVAKYKNILFRYIGIHFAIFWIIIMLSLRKYLLLSIFTILWIL